MRKKRRDPHRLRRGGGRGVAVLLVAALASALVPGPASAEESAAQPPALLEVARRVVTEARYCSLITLGPDGRAESRIVDPFAPEADWTVWIATRPVTRKVAEIRASPHVTLSYWAPDSLAYVTLIGDAELVDAPAEKAKRWKPEWRDFYRDENRGDDYLLIRVTPRRLELVSLADGVGGDPETWRPAQHDFASAPTPIPAE